MFIVLEGIDGAGKSTAIQIVRDFFSTSNFDASGAERKITLVRDPGSTDLSLAIRQILLTETSTKIAPLSELLLYCAARAQLLAEVVIPALRNDEIVISDRYFWSTLAYQGAILSITKSLKNLVFSAANNLFPDLTVLLDLPAEKSFTRLQRTADRIESRGVDYLERVRQNYLQLVDELPETKKMVIDAAAEIATVQRQIATALTERFA